MIAYIGVFFVGFWFGWMGAMWVVKERRLRQSGNIYAIYIFGDRENAWQTLKQRFPIMWMMPCGHLVCFDHIEDIPKKSMRCPCGNRKHWIVKYD